METDASILPIPRSVLLCDASFNRGNTPPCCRQHFGLENQFLFLPHCHPPKNDRKVVVPPFLSFFGARQVIATRDSPISCNQSRWSDSNRRPTLYESVALPAELQRLMFFTSKCCVDFWLHAPDRLQPLVWISQKRDPITSTAGLSDDSLPLRRESSREFTNSFPFGKATTSKA
jgi:hypothetical protein